MCGLSGSCVGFAWQEKICRDSDSDVVMNVRGRSYLVLAINVEGLDGRNFNVDTVKVSDRMSHDDLYRKVAATLGRPVKLIVSSFSPFEYDSYERIDINRLRLDPILFID